MNDSTRRAVRTGIDMILAILTSVAAVFVVPGFNEAIEKMGYGQLIATWSTMIVALVMFFSKLKNALEDVGKIPALLKAPASDGVDPVPSVDDNATDEAEYDIDDELTPQGIITEEPQGDDTQDPEAQQ